MEDFESTPEFQALIVAAAGKPERSMGDSVIPAEPPQWNAVRQLAQRLLGTADNQLAVHVYFVQAEANVIGFSGFQQSLQGMLTLLQGRWDEMYPAPDLDDPDDMYYARVNLVNELAEQPRFIDAIYRLPLVSVKRLGAFSTRDIDISTGAVSASDEDQARCQEGLIRGAFAETDKEQHQQLAAALDALPGICTAIEEVFAEKSGQQNVLSLANLKKRIETCRQRFHEFADEYLDEAMDAETETAGESTDTASSASPDPLAVSEAPATSSTLESRDMVKASFDAILLYYQHHEPSSPVRILTLCARGIVEKPFFEILQVLAPAQRDDLPALLLQVQKQPSAALLGDSYNRFLAGETIPLVNDDAGDAGNSHTVPVISSRAQVIQVLQDIEIFFHNAEPASPIPLILGEIRKLVPKRFTELIAEFSRLLPVSDGIVNE